MLPTPRKVPFVSRNSLHSIPAIRSLAWRRGAGADDLYDPAVQGPDPYYDPNVEAGTGTKSAYDSGVSAPSQSGGQLPNPNTSVYGATQVVTTTGVNLRNQPSVLGAVVAGENPGTILQVVGPQQDGWLNVQDPQGRVGWVYSAYVTDATQGQGTVAAPSSPSGGTVLSRTAPVSGATVSSMPVGAGGIVGLLVVGGLVVGAYYLLVK